MKNQVQLITYVDRLGDGGFADLSACLRGPLAGLFGGVHLLPFFTPIDGADAGFDPSDHTQVDPRLGNWNDVRDLCGSFDVMADVIVNHVSADSPQFRDVLERGNASVYSDLFLTRESVFPCGASDAELRAIHRPRPGLPFTEMTLRNGERRAFWTTFTPKQLDINVTHPAGQAYLDGILQTFSANGIRIIRLDAAGYAIKRAGTSCFMLPETFDFIARFISQARALGMEVLVETHSYFQQQLEIAHHVDWVYDFALPPLLLHAFNIGTALPLQNWIRIRPRNALTVLDTHDGIGIVDIGADPTGRLARPGLVSPGQLDELVESIHRNSAGASRKATGVAASNVDLYQVNCTFYEAMGRDDRRYLLARALQYFLPGIPQVYYVGLLAGDNDLDLLARTGVGRDINRHHYDEREIALAIERTVVQRHFDLIRLRNRHVAFNGSFALEVGDERSVTLAWTQGNERASLRVDFLTAAYRLEYTEDGVNRTLDLG